MKRDSVAAMILAVGGILALALAGATIQDLREEGEGGGPEEGNGGGGFPEPEGGMPDITVEPIIPGEIVMAILFLIATILVLIYLIKNWQESLHLVIVIAFFAILMFLLFHLIPWDADFTPINETYEFGERVGGDEGGGGGGASPPIVGEWFPIFLLLGGFAVLVVAVVIISSRSNEIDATPVEPEDEPDTRLTSDLGAAAGRAADRMETEHETENEVYRAWAEMVGLLDVGDPQSAPPGTFARHARQAGMAPEDVDSLTELFEEVRYGNRTVTDDREEAAIALLRRIEDRYAMEEESKDGFNARI